MGVALSGYSAGTVELYKSVPSAYLKSVSGCNKDRANSRFMAGFRGLVFCHKSKRLQDSSGDGGGYIFLGIVSSE